MGLLIFSGNLPKKYIRKVVEIANGPRGGRAPLHIARAKQAKDGESRRQAKDGGKSEVPPSPFICSESSGGRISPVLPSSPSLLRRPFQRRGAIQEVLKVT